MQNRTHFPCAPMFGYKQPCCALMSRCWGWSPPLSHKSLRRLANHNLNYHRHYRYIPEEQKKLVVTIILRGTPISLCDIVKAQRRANVTKGNPPLASVSGGCHIWLFVPNIGAHGVSCNKISAHNQLLTELPPSRVPTIPKPFIKHRITY